MMCNKPRQFDWIKVVLNVFGSPSEEDKRVCGGAGKEWRLCHELDLYMKKASSLKDIPIPISSLKD